MTDVLSTFKPDMLRGQCAVITGGSGSIGRATVLALARVGANVVVGYWNEQRGAEEVCHEASSYDVRALPVRVDVTQADQVDQFMDQAVRTIGPLDILINCAGNWPAAKIWEMEDRDWNDTLAINLSGTYYTCKVASKMMMERRRGRIVNFSSIAAERGARTGHAHYAAAKGGVSAFTRSLAYDLGPFDTTVNAVAPGMIRTGMTDAALKERVADYIEQIPMARIGTPEEVAGLVVYLVSPAAAYITGQIIHVNGGMWMS